MKPQVYWRPLLLSKKSTSHTHPHKVTKKEKSIFYSSMHMKPKVCCRPLLLSKNLHLIRTPIRSPKKRNGFFTVARALVANLMATNARKLRDPRLEV